MRVLITGANGFIGKNLLYRLLERHYNVATITRIPIIVDNEINYNFDIKNYNELSYCLKDFNPDIVVHLAATGVKQVNQQVEHIFDINSFSVYHMFKICKSINIKPKFIIASSGFEYAESSEPLDENCRVFPRSLYGISKATQTMLLQQFQNDFSIYLLRFFGVYGIGESESRLIPYIISESFQGNEIRLTAAEQLRDFLYIDDAVDVLIRFINYKDNNGLRTFNVSTGNPLSLKAVVETIREKMVALNHQVNIVYGAIPYRQDEPMIYTADISKLERYLNWQPKVDIEQGIEKMLKEFHRNVER